MKIKMIIDCEFDLFEIKSSLENKNQALNNELVLKYINTHLLKDAINSAQFVNLVSKKSGNKGFLNQQISEYNKEC